MKEKISLFSGRCVWLSETENLGVIISAEEWLCSGYGSCIRAVDACFYFFFLFALLLFSPLFDTMLCGTQSFQISALRENNLFTAI